MMDPAGRLWTTTDRLSWAAAPPPHVDRESSLADTEQVTRWHVRAVSAK